MTTSTLIILLIALTCPAWSASGRGFKCRNGLHVSMGHVCDNINSCGDNSDENPYLCEHICTFMGRKRFECWETANIHGCVFGMELYQWCDGVNQCLTTRDLTRVAEDEKYCDYSGPFGDDNPHLRDNERDRYVPPDEEGEEENESAETEAERDEKDKYQDFKDSIALLGGILGAIFFSVVGLTLIVCCLCVCRKCHAWRQGRHRHSKKSHHATTPASDRTRHPSSSLQRGDPRHHGSFAGSQMAIAAPASTLPSSASGAPLHAAVGQTHAQSGSQAQSGSRAQTPRCTTPASIHSNVRPGTPDAPTNVPPFPNASHPMAHRPLPPPPPPPNPFPQFTPGTYPGCGPDDSCPPSYNGSLAGTDNYCPPTYNDVINPPFNPTYHR